MHLVCMFNDNLDAIPNTLSLVPLNITVCIPEVTKEKLTHCAMPAATPGNLCMDCKDGDIVRLSTPNNVAFYFEHLSKLIYATLPFFDTELMVYGDAIMTIKKIGELRDGKYIANIAIHIDEKTDEVLTTHPIPTVTSLTIYPVNKEAVGRWIDTTIPPRRYLLAGS